MVSWNQTCVGPNQVAQRVLCATQFAPMKRLMMSLRARSLSILHCNEVSKFNYFKGCVPPYSQFSKSVSPELSHFKLKDNEN